MGPPPVARIRSTCLISSLDLSRVMPSMPITRSSGQPCFFSTPRIWAMALSLVFWALGCGAMMMALRVLMANSAFTKGVASPLVTGRRAPTTPTGLAIFMIPFSLSSSTTPTDFLPFMSRRAPFTLVICLANLWAGTPKPVSWEQNSVYGLAKSGRTPAQATRVHISSTCSWVASSILACALRARSTSPLMYCWTWARSCVSAMFPFSFSSSSPACRCSPGPSR